MNRVIGILQTGDGAPELHTAFGDYPHIWQRWLSRHAGQVAARSYDVRRGILPKSPHECAGWIVTGSDDHVYDRLHWMPAAEEFLQQVHASQLPMLGICYGHQMMAHALGGQVERAATGLEIGLKEYRWSGRGHPVVLPAYHYDQVIQPPASARILAHNPTCPHAVLAYGTTALTLQGHPEFSVDYLRALIALDVDHPEDGPALRKGLCSLDRLTSGAEALSRELAAFLLGDPALLSS